MAMGMSWKQCDLTPGGGVGGSALANRVAGGKKNMKNFFLRGSHRVRRELRVGGIFRATVLQMDVMTITQEGGQEDTFIHIYCIAAQSLSLSLFKCVQTTLLHN